jgi:hypothetical protein
MNDHPGERPRWRIDEVREILEIDAQQTPVSTSPNSEHAQRDPRVARTPVSELRSQRVTASDIAHGQIRLPRETDTILPSAKSTVEVDGTVGAWA